MSNAPPCRRTQPQDIFQHLMRAAFIFCLTALFYANALFCSNLLFASSTLANTTREFATDPDAPIDIDARQLDIFRQTERAVFSGNVEAVQGPLALFSNMAELRQSADSGEVKTIRAEGEVRIISENGQTAMGDWAVYNLPMKIITMGGVVTLIRGESILRGHRLKIDMDTGIGRLTGEAPPAKATDAGDAGSGATEQKSGRVRGILVPEKQPPQPR